MRQTFERRDISDHRHHKRPDSQDVAVGRKCEVCQGHALCGVADSVGNVLVRKSKSLLVYGALLIREVFKHLVGYAGSSVSRTSEAEAAGEGATIRNQGGAPECRDQQLIFFLVRSFHSGSRIFQVCPDRSEVNKAPACRMVESSVRQFLHEFTVAIEVRNDTAGAVVAQSGVGTGQAIPRRMVTR